MRTLVRKGSSPGCVAALLCLAASAASAAKPPDPARAEVELLVREAAQQEKSDGCEAAYLSYRKAAARLPDIKDKARAAQLEAIVTGKTDKLDACYQACQPTESQRALMDGAKAAAEQEPRRATAIARRLLAGKTASAMKCAFWSDARAFLRTMPGEAVAMDDAKVDPCEMSADEQRALQDARNASYRSRQAFAELGGEKARPALASSQKLEELVASLRAMEDARGKLVDMRERFLECDSLHKPLVGEAQALRSSHQQATTLALNTYQSRLQTLAKRMRDAQVRLGEQELQLAMFSGLQKQFDELSAINDQLYEDLIGLSTAEALSFSVEVEGRRVEQPVEEIRKLMASESAVLEKLQQKYPEYFEDGTNLEGLKRRKGTLEKVRAMLTRFAGKANRPAHQRAVAEMDATIEMMAKALAKNEPKAQAAGKQAPAGSSLPWFLGGGAVLAVAGFTFFRMRMAEKNVRTGIL